MGLKFGALIREDIDMRDFGCGFALYSRGRGKSVVLLAEALGGTSRVRLMSTDPQGLLTETAAIPVLEHIVGLWNKDARQRRLSDAEEPEAVTPEPPTEPSYPNPMSYPPALAKACVDPFDYAMGLRNGSVLFFEHAVAVSRTWVTIMGVKQGPPAVLDDGTPDRNNAIFGRGLDVRVSQIAWVADAPYGS